jgi:hypothetical protein
MKLVIACVAVVLLIQRAGELVAGKAAEWR